MDYHYWAVVEDGITVIKCSKNYPHVVGAIKDGQLVLNENATDSRDVILAAVREVAEAEELTLQIRIYEEMDFWRRLKAAH